MIRGHAYLTFCRNFTNPRVRIWKAIWEEKLNWKAHVVICQYIIKSTYGKRKKIIFHFSKLLTNHFEGLARNCSNFSSLSMELLQSCAKPLISVSFITQFPNMDYHTCRKHVLNPRHQTPQGTPIAKHKHCCRPSAVNHVNLTQRISMVIK